MAQLRDNLCLKNKCKLAVVPWNVGINLVGFLYKLQTHSVCAMLQVNWGDPLAVSCISVTYSPNFPHHKYKSFAATMLVVATRSTWKLTYKKSRHTRLRARCTRANRRSKVNKIYFILKHLLEKKMTCKKNEEKKRNRRDRKLSYKRWKNRAGKEDIHEAKVVTSFPTNPQANKLNSTFAESPVSFCPSRHEADG